MLMKVFSERKDRDKMHMNTNGEEIKHRSDARATKTLGWVTF